jgi:hypothetical protein
MLSKVVDLRLCLAVLTGVSALPQVARAGYGDEWVPHNIMSTTGGHRATAYPGGNKIITTGSGASRKTYVTWVDYIGPDTTNTAQRNGSRVMFRSFNHATNTWSAAQDLGDAYDDHGGGALTVDGGGRLNIVYGAHQTDPYNSAITTPFKYRRMLDSSNATWGPEEIIVDYSNVNSSGGGTSIDYDPTYPSMVADLNDPEKLHLVFRGASEMPMGIQYFRRQLTNYGVNGSQQGYKWNKVQTLVRKLRTPNEPYYAEYGNALGIGPTGTLHVAYHFEQGVDPNPSQGTTTTQDYIGYLKSTDGGNTWKSAANQTLTLPALPDSGPALVTYRPGSELAIGGIDVDANDNPWFTVTDRDHKTFEIYHHNGSNWANKDLTPVFSVLNPNFNVVGEAQISISDDDNEIMVVASYNSFADRWGDPSAEIALMRSTDNGLNWYVRNISPKDPLKANWSALIERDTGHNVVTDPMIMYSHGNYYDVHNEVRFVNGTGLGLEEGFWFTSATTCTWQVNASGDWNAPGNWQQEIPNGIGAIAVLGGIITSPRTVYTDAQVKLGNLKFDSIRGYQITGQGSLVIEVSNGSGLINVTQGSHKINLPLVFASNANVTVAPGATLTFSDPTRIKSGKTVTKTGDLRIEAPLILEAGASLVLASGGATLAGAPSLASGAQIDLRTTSLTIDYQNQPSPLDVILHQLESGWNGGLWNGEGIASSAATSGAGVGWIDSGATDSIVVRFAYYGDADLNGSVDSLDFNVFVQGYGDAGVWINGDFNYDGRVNTLDFNSLSGNFGSTMQPAGLGAVVPEPAAVSLVAAASCIAGRRSSRGSRK